MNLFLKLKLKMKLGYEYYNRRLEVDVLIVKAIYKTVEESCNVARSELQRFLQKDDGMPFIMMQASEEVELGGKMPIEHRDDLVTVTAKCLIKLEDGLPPD